MELQSSCLSSNSFTILSNPCPVVNAKNRTIEELEEKMRLMSIVKSVKTEDKKSVNNELKQIIRMIDECILSLNAE